MFALYANCFCLRICRDLVCVIHLVSLLFCVSVCYSVYLFVCYSVCSSVSALLNLIVLHLWMFWQPTKCSILFIQNNLTVNTWIRNWNYLPKLDAKNEVEYCKRIKILFASKWFSTGYCSLTNLNCSNWKNFSMFIVPWLKFKGILRSLWLSVHLADVSMLVDFFPPNLQHNNWHLFYLKFKRCKCIFLCLATLHVEVKWKGQNMHVKRTESKMLIFFWIGYFKNQILQQPLVFLLALL